MQRRDADTIAFGAISFRVTRLMLAVLGERAEICDVRGEAEFTWAGPPRKASSQTQDILWVRCAVLDGPPRACRACACVMEV